MKKIIYVSDSFKGTLTNEHIVNIANKVFKKYTNDFETTVIPIADGGEGTIQAFKQIIGGSYKILTVYNPLFEPIKAKYLLKDDIAVIELAQASGLSRIGGTLSIGLTTTMGTGELIKDAIKNGAKKIYLGLGDSATNDGGCGIACALGTKFYDKMGNEFIPTASTIKEITDVEIHKELLDGVEVIALTDVKNLLCGENGAAYIYGPQKGANKDHLRELDLSLKFLAGIIKNKYGLDYENEPGSGAAGGAGYGALVYLNAKIKPGINTILNMMRFNKLLEEADYVITGEGSLDTQTLDGKVIFDITKRANKNNVKVICICGRVSDDFYDKNKKLKFDKIVEISPKDVTFETIKKNANRYYYKALSNVLDEIK